MKTHQYKIKTTWTGNTGKGTQSYAVYNRDYDVQAEGKTVIKGSSDPAFRGDKLRYNPEDMLMASLSSCHMLWYLHLCSEAGVVVEHYEDEAEGVMEESSNGSGKFTQVTLNPFVIVENNRMVEKALKLHHRANEMCFIANSCNFPVYHKPLVKVK